MNPIYEKVESCVEQIRKKTEFKPQIAIVLGSGLGSLAESVKQEAIVEYGELEEFPVSTVDGHKGRFIMGYIEKTPVIMMQGRVHYYEGYDMSDVVLPIRVMARLGAEVLFLTNSAGGANTMYRPGDFMMITDHIASFMPSPLRGANIPEYGDRFVSMDHIYDDTLCKVIRTTSREVGIPLREGVYVQMRGPQYETEAEVKMCQVLGGDVVGMSTAVEAIAGKHMGMKVCGVSCITNMACGISKVPLNHMEVSKVGETQSPKFQKLVYGAVSRMAKALEGDTTPTNSTIITDDTDSTFTMSFEPVQTAAYGGGIGGAIIDDL